MKMNLFKKQPQEEVELPFETVKPKKKDIERNGNGNKVLAVWGNQNSGKTTVSCRIARQLASKKYNVVLILADMNTPPLPYICPPADLESPRSMGAILASPAVDERLVQENCTLHRKNDHLTILGLKKGENVFSYPQYTDKQAQELISCARSFADYVIIDCTSNIANDTFSAVAIMCADVTLRLVSCDLKAVSFLSSQLPLLGDARWKADKQMKIASNIKPAQAKENIEQVLGGVNFSIPHSDEVEQLFLNGNMFGELIATGSRAFKKEINGITEAVLNV